MKARSQDNTLFKDMSMAKIVYCQIYYLDTDVVKMDGNDIPKNCLTCNYRSEQSFCVIVGDYVGEINRCSEWESKYAK